MNNERRRRRATARGAMVLAVSAIVTSCSDSDPVLDHGPANSIVVVGTPNSNQGELIAQVYANALARTGVSISVAEPADRATNLARLDSGAVTLVPENTGALLAQLDPAAVPGTPDEVFAALNRSLPQGLSTTDYGVADDRPRLEVSRGVVDRLGTADLEALGPHCAELTLGVIEPLTESTVAELAADYGCVFGEIRTFAPTDLDTAVRTGTVDAVVTSGESDADLVPLADDAYAFGADNVVPVFRTGALSDAAILKLNVVGAELTTSDLTTLVERVEGGGDPATVARAWLDQRGL